MLAPLSLISNIVVLVFVLGLALCSPEMIDQQPYDTKGDVWALGVVLDELMAKENPFSGADVQVSLRALLTRIFTDLWSFFLEKFTIRLCCTAALFIYQCIALLCSLLQALLFNILRLNYSLPPGCYSTELRNLINAILCRYMVQLG